MTTSKTLAAWSQSGSETPGWRATVGQHRLAVAIARTVPGGTARRAGAGEWQACLPATTLTVALVGADSEALWCELGAEPSLGVFTLVFAPWPAAIVLRCPVPGFPVTGMLLTRDVRHTTKMGRTIRYLIPQFTTN